MEVGQEKGGFKGVGDVGVARLAHLARVAFVGVEVRLPHKFGAVFGQVGSDPFDKGLCGF